MSAKPAATVVRAERPPASRLPLPVDQARVDAVHEALLVWFAVHGRRLPWRDTADAYQIVVAEFMLQQTQVDRVLPKYHAFLAQFPTIAALAAAPVAEVIRAWAGLGYNRRAVNLHALARTVLAEHGGALPADRATLRSLPGIGDYTADAVACFAFRQDSACVDTNIRRVLWRVFRGPDVPAATARAREVQQLAVAVLPAGDAYPWNQALMDLGALVCSTTSPRCGVCPLADHCVAFAATGAPPVDRVLRERPAGYHTVPFRESSRYYRGRVVAVLRTIANGGTLPLVALGERIRDAWRLDLLDWLAELVAGLERDGLVQVERAGNATEWRVRLPD